MVPLNSSTDTLFNVANPDPSTLWVLTVPAVRWGIETLTKQKLHPTLPMYLYLRKKALSGELSTAAASSGELLSLIALPGNPEKPYYFPMIDRGARDQGPLPTFWRSPNISGSWSAGSIRRQQAARWLADDSGHYVMPADNADLALKNLLYGDRVSAKALGAFFLRDDVFLMDTMPGEPDLIDAFRTKFDFQGPNGGDFDTLFSTVESIVDDGPFPDPWFEPAPFEVVERLIG